jgi:hypothetical protein
VSAAAYKYGACIQCGTPLELSDHGEDSQLECEVEERARKALRSEVSDALDEILEASPHTDELRAHGQKELEEVLRAVESWANSVRRLYRDRKEMEKVIR